MYRRAGYDERDIFKWQRESWDFSPIFLACLPPIPKFTIRCPICGSDRICLKEWVLHHHPRMGTRQYRLDVYCKCMKCGLVFVFGLHLKENEYFEIKRRCTEHKTYGEYGHICYHEG